MGAYGDMGIYLVIVAGALAVILTIAPLGIWTSQTQTNKLLKETNTLLKKLSEK